MSGDWSEVREGGVLPVAEAFGLQCKRPGSFRHGLAPCPACGADNRTTEHHPDPKRGPVGLTRDHMGWCCHVCGVRGDAVTLAAYLVGQQGQVNREVAEACKRKGLLHNGRAPREPRPPPAPRAPEYLPATELRRFVDKLVPIAHEDARDVRVWLMSRKIDPGWFRENDVIKALPPKTTGALWAQCKGQLWSKVGYRLIAPLYDASGVMRGFHARAVVSGLDPKGANPAGYELAGLLLACPLARLWLRGDDAGIARVRNEGLVICEGLVDWLFQMTGQGGTQGAVLGIMSGSWTPAFADKVPDGCRVILATDRDADGDKYAEKIGKTLSNDVDIRRWTPQSPQQI